jgi:hypothetical protein
MKHSTRVADHNGTTMSASAQRRAGAVVMIAAAALAQFCASAALAGAPEQAARIYARLAGVPPDNQTLQTMITDIQGGNALAAADLAMQNDNFYSVVLKNFAMPWSNVDQTPFAPLNDYVATFIGIVRDDVPFNTALSADIIYVGATPGLPAYSATDNNHYAALETSAAHLGDPTVLVQKAQSQVTGLPTQAAAGLITTRASAQAFFSLGTNRRMFRFLMINQMCNDMPTLMDTSRPTDRIRQDVSRSPGGDSTLFFNNCVGCHSGMDPMAQAFAHYDFTTPINPSTNAPDPTNGQITYTPTTIAPKYFHNNTTFPDGFITPDDSWSNRWRSGPNSLLGWDPSQSGSSSGAPTLGKEIAGSDQFAACQVQKVFQNVCLRLPQTAADLAQAAQMKADFKANGKYSMKQMFAEAAVYCMGQ